MAVPIFSIDEAILQNDAFIFKKLFLKKESSNKKDEYILNMLVMLTGSFMGEIDRLALSKGLDTDNLCGAVNGYSYFLVYTATFMAEQKTQLNKSYLDTYKNSVCKAHASSAENINFVEDYYEKARTFYTLILKENEDSPEIFMRLSEAFIDAACIQPIQDKELRKEFLLAVAELTESRHSMLVKELQKFFV